MFALKLAKSANISQTTFLMMKNSLWAHKTPNSMLSSNPLKKVQKVHPKNVIDKNICAQ
jgi:hypothetical protein